MECQGDDRIFNFVFIFICCQLLLSHPDGIKHQHPRILKSKNNNQFMPRLRSMERAEYAVGSVSSIQCEP